MNRDPRYRQQPSAPAVPLRRIFFALWPDEATRAALRRATRALQRHCGGKPVAPEGFHLTLAFLGNVPEERCAALVAAAAGLELPPLTLTLDRIGYFQEAQVLWIGPSVDPEPLRDFVARLWRALDAADVPADIRPFHPHVTIARKVAAPRGLGPPRPVSWPLTGFTLLESETRPQGAQYRPVAEFPGHG
jgi:2'-5' RNA ligase